MIRINENYLKLKPSYLFSEISRRVSAYHDANPDNAIIRLGIGDVELYPQRSEEALEAAAAHMRTDAVTLWADLGIGAGTFTAYGCDLTDGYIRINADYTT